VADEGMRLCLVGHMSGDAAEGPPNFAVHRTGARVARSGR
jgi:hypothetical protein